MPATIEIPKPTHREQLPVRSCEKCRAYLRTGNESTVCDPCGKPDWELTDAEVIELICELPDVRGRRKAFEALGDITERAAA